MSIINTIYAADGVDLTGLESNVSGGLGLNKFTTIGNLLTGGTINLINLLFFIVGLLFFVSLVMAGWDYMLSSGDPKKISSATTRLLNSFIGLIMAVTAFVVVRLISAVIGIEF